MLVVIQKLYIDLLQNKRNLALKEEFKMYIFLASKGSLNMQSYFFLLRRLRTVIKTYGSKLDNYDELLTLT